MKSTIRDNRFYNAKPLTAGFRMLTAALLVFGFVTSPLAQTPVPRQGSLPTGRLVITGVSTVITQTRNFNLNVTPTSLFVWGPRYIVSGTGTLRLTGTLTNTIGACARIKLVIIRKAGIVYNNHKEQTYEFCGSQSVNISDILDASEDDAEFSVQMTNLDAWNKLTVTGALSLNYPTADKILTAQPNVPVDLTRGVDVTRLFNLTPNTAGSVKVEIRWSGGATLQAKLFKPGTTAGAANSGVLNPLPNSSGALDLIYDIQAADITAGDEWAINVLNTSSSSITATGITFRVVYTVEQ